MRDTRDGINRGAAALDGLAKSHAQKLNGTSKPERFTGTWADNLALNIGQRDLIKGLLPHSALAQIFGEPGCGKSALAIELACHVALGRAWQNLNVTQTTCGYIALENPTSIERRVIAWAQYNNVDRDELPLLILRGELNFAAGIDHAKLIEYLRVMGNERGAIKLIFIDTQSRLLPGVDENNFDAASSLVRACDAIREDLGATVVLIHHSGKDSTRGARGHSAVHGALDTSLEVADRCVTVRKSRDSESGAKFSFELKPVELGTDIDGDPVTAVVCVEAKGKEPARKPLKLTPGEQIGLDCFRDALSSHGELLPPTSQHGAVRAVKTETWRENFNRRYPADNATAKRQAWKRIIDTLIGSHVIGVSDPWAWFWDKA